MDKKELISLPIEILANISPRIEKFKDSFETVCSVSDLILCEKLQRFFEKLNKQDADFAKRVDWARHFSKDSKKYKENSRRLVHVINSMNDDDKIDVFANLTRAFLLNLIDLNMFWRLCSVLQNIYIEDVQDLYKFIRGDISYRSITNIYALQYHYLIVITNEFTHGALGGNLHYAPTKIGLELIRCGYDYDNYPNYKNCTTGERKNSDSE